MSDKPRFIPGTDIAPHTATTTPRLSAADRALAGNLRRLRRERGIALDAVAALLGVSYQQVQKYESGANRISLTRLALLRDFYGVSLDDFLDGVPGTSRRAPTAAEDTAIMDLCQKIARMPDNDMRLRAGRILESLLTHG